MPYYYYLLLMITVLIVVYFIRYVLLRSKSSPLQLFNDGLRDENSGHFTEAVINYENALTKVDRVRFHSYLKIRIHEKLKVLYTIIEYEKSMHLTKRINNSTDTKWNFIFKILYPLQYAGFFLINFLWTQAKCIFLLTSWSNKTFAMQAVVGARLPDWQAAKVVTCRGRCPHRPFLPNRKFAESFLNSFLTGKMPAGRYFVSTWL